MRSVLAPFAAAIARASKCPDAIRTKPMTTPAGLRGPTTVGMTHKNRLPSGNRRLLFIGELKQLVDVAPGVGDEGNLFYAESGRTIEHVDEDFDSAAP